MHGTPARPLEGVRLDDIERGILWTVVYASIFHAPIRLSALWSRIAGVAATADEISRALDGSALRAVIDVRDGLVSLRSQDVRREFGRRSADTSALLQRHGDILAFVRRLPRVRMAALSGGCAHEAADDGDIDIFAVTEAGAAWRTLLFATLVAKKRGWRRILCLNYLVDVRAQELPWRDFYGGFELISLKVLRGEEGFDDLVAANPWVEKMFPNFFRSRVHGQNPCNKNLDVSRGRVLEATARMIQRSYLRYRLPNTPGVELSNRVIRLHTSDHRERLRGLFKDALRNIGMEAPSWI